MSQPASPLAKPKSRPGISAHKNAGTFVASLDAAAENALIRRPLLAQARTHRHDASPSNWPVARRIPRLDSQNRDGRISNIVVEFDR
jgi:hypothetical protein